MVTSHDALFAFLAGVFGSVGTLGLYQALANGKMGIAAPLTAAIANAIALLYGALTVLRACHPVWSPRRGSGPLASLPPDHGRVGDGDPARAFDPRAMGGVALAVGSVVLIVL
jgi:hypothetical protein